MLTRLRPRITWLVAGKITTQAKMGDEKSVRGVAAKIGFDSGVGDLSSVALMAELAQKRAKGERCSGSLRNL